MGEFRLVGSTGLTTESRNFKRDWGVDMGVPENMRIELNKDGTMTIEGHIITLNADQHEKLKEVIYELNHPVLP